MRLRGFEFVGRTVRSLGTVLALMALATGTAEAAGDADHGKALFARCVTCHAATAQNKVGPGLAGVVGRQAGTAPGFRYSKALVAYAKVWDDQNLDSYLAAPSKLVPGTSMTINVPSAADRADIIAYLKTLGGK